MMAYQRYRQGDGMETGYQEPTSSQYNDHSNKGGYKPSPYASFPHPGEDGGSSYQQQPFGVPDQPFGVPPSQPVKTDNVYNVPDY